MKCQPCPHTPTMIDDPGCHRKGALAPLRPYSPGPESTPWARGLVTTWQPASSPTTNRPDCVLASIRDVFVRRGILPNPSAKTSGPVYASMISITTSLRAKRRAHPLLEEESDARYIV